jgi:large subunit ribosomal protein L22
MVGYSAQLDPENTAKAIGKELRISPKHSVEICRAIRGLPLDKAKEYLEDVIALKRAVPFRRYRRCVGHRKGKRFGAGRYPRKAARAILEVLLSAENNAEYKGLNTDIMVVAHISANHGRPFKGWTPRAHGRSSPFNVETTNIEVILQERE